MIDAAFEYEESDNNCNLEILIYDHCSHLIFPESMVKLLLPGLLVDLILPRFYSETKWYAVIAARTIMLKRTCTEQFMVAPIDYGLLTSIYT